MSLNLLEPTKTKEKLLRETYTSFISMVKEALGCVGDVGSRAELHRKTYEMFRSKYGVASQLVVEAASHAWSIRKTVKEEVRKRVVRFDSRLFSFRETRRGNPVLSLRLNHKRIAVPISVDGAFQRLQKHLEEGWRATSIIMKWNLNFFVVLSKQFPKPAVRPNWMGVDVNSSKIAVSIVGEGKVLKQTYFGQNVSTTQFHFENRRAKLQRYRDNGSSKAGLKLKRLSGKQRNYVRTRVWQIANQIGSISLRS